ncbi:MAG TPA: inositol monophosphatase family protein, partial [Pyrinomonadaceae bacterium]|nr:inositol monophosphatase family protein [Pyrinomonadaceae bacterium]
IGLEIKDEAILGVVNIPALSELVYGARGVGCFWNGKRTRVSANSDLKEALLLATDFGGCDQYGFGDAAERLQSLVKQRRTWGDCYGHLLVATGRAEIMLDPVMNVWDCAALQPIVEAAGGTFTDWNGVRTIRGGNAISTNGVLFDQVLKVIRDE